MTEIIRVLVNGAKGRMGCEVVRAVSEDEGMTLAGQTDLGDDLAKAIRETNPHVVVDFTIPSAAFANVQTILGSSAGAVVGTTGFTPEQIEKLGKQCEGRKPAVIIAPNFTIGAIMMMHCAQIVAKYMPKVEIIEFHHDKKVDAPSGTAVKTAELIAAANSETNVPRGTFEPGPRGDLYSGIPVHSVRLPGMLAHQEVIFGCEGQTLTIRHDSINRSCYMPGVLMACRESVKRSGLIYGLEKILFAE